MPVRHDDPRPPYLQLAEELRQAITNGEYEPGDRLPSRRKLAFEHRIAEMTVVHAIEVLADEGLVVAQHGRGVFVQEVALPEVEPRTVAETLAATRAMLAETRALLDDTDAKLARVQAGRPGNDHDQAAGVDVEADGLTFEETMAAIKANLAEADAAIEAANSQGYDPGPGADYGPEPDRGPDIGM